MKFGTGKILLKKTLRDLKNQFKQFLSIIFIIGIAVTLFVGLQANYSSIKNRVQKVYDDGNMADIWVTYDMINEDDNDAANIKNLFAYADNVVSEERLYIPGTMESQDATFLFSKSYPVLNRASNLYANDPNDSSKLIETSSFNLNDGEFCVVDKSFLAAYALTNNSQKPKIGDKIKVSIDITSAKDSIEKSLNATIDKMVNDFDKNHTIISEAQIEEIKNSIEEFLQNSEFTSIDITPRITNFMVHPENIASSKNSSPVTLISNKTFINSVLDVVYKYMQDKGSSITREQLNILYNYVGSTSIANQLVFKFGNKKIDTKKACDKIRSFLASKIIEEGDNGNLLYLNDLENLPSNLTIQNDIDQAVALSYVFPIVFLLVAVLIAITTITQIVIKEHTIIGTFKALGLSNNEIIRHYLLTDVTLAFIGCLFGCILGPFVIPYIMDIKYLILYSIVPTSYVFPTLAALLMSAGVIAVICLITYFLLKKELRLSPAENMLPELPKIKMKKKSTSNKIKTDISLRMAFRNIRAYFTKSIMVIIGILGCTALLVCGFGIEDTINYGIDNDLTKYYNSDIMVSYSSGSTTLENTIKNDEELKKISTINAFYPLTQGIATVQYNTSGEYNVQVFYANKITYNNRILDIVFDDNTIAIPKKKAKDINVKLGDFVKLNISGKIIEKKVSLIYEHFSMQTIFAHTEDPDFATYVAKPTNLYLDVNDAASKETIQKMADYISTIEGISVVTTSAGMRETISSYVSSVKEMTNTIKVFAVLLAVICLINLTLLNFKERTREIATLKVLGFSTPEIGRSLIYESMFLTMIGAAIGLAFGFPMEFLVLSINQNNMVSFIYYIAPLTFILSFIISVVTDFIINVILTFSIKKVHMVESLKSVE